jgi:hypothetical protein
MAFSQMSRNRLFLAFTWAFTLVFLGTTEASEQDRNLGPGFYYVEPPGMTYAGRLEDAQLTQQTGRICRMDRMGHMRTEVFVFKDKDDAPESLALDELTARLYFTSGKTRDGNKHPGKIQRLDTDGSGLQTIVTTDSMPCNLKLVYHPNQKMLYWIEGEDRNLIKRFNLNNRTGIETIVDASKYPCGADGTSKCLPVEDIAIDATKSDLYWTQGTRFTREPGSIRRLSLLLKPGETATNRTAVQILRTDMKWPRTIKYDRGTLYWVEEINGGMSGSNVMKMSMNGSAAAHEPEMLFHTPEAQQGQMIEDFAVDADRGLLWAFIGYMFSGFYGKNLKTGAVTLLRGTMAHSQSLAYTK